MASNYSSKLCCNLRITHTGIGLLLNSQVNYFLIWMGISWVKCAKANLKAQSWHTFSTSSDWANFRLVNLITSLDQYWRQKITCSCGMMYGVPTGETALVVFIIWIYENNIHAECLLQPQQQIIHRHHMFSEEYIIPKDALCLVHPLFWLQLFFLQSQERLLSGKMLWTIAFEGFWY